MSEKIVFYTLSQKFLERQEDVPEQAQQIVYQALGLGHHIGVIDCLKALLSCPREGYERWIGQMPEGEARRKLEGVLKFGEITIDATHTQLLGHALAPLVDGLPEEEAGWSRQLLQALAAIEAEPAMYLMARRRA